MKKRIIYLTALMFSMLIFTGCVSSSPVVVAAKNKDFTTMKQEIDKGSKVNAVDESGTTALMYAAKSGDLETVKYLISKGAGINIKSNKNWTALHFAVQNNSLEIVKILVEHNANVNAQTKDGWTPLHMAARYNSLDTVKYLVDKGAYIDTQNLYQGRANYTALHLAIFRKDEQLKEQKAIVNFLLNNGANVNINASKGWTLLHLACRYKSDLDIVNQIIEHNANINARTSDGWSVLHMASRYSTLDVVKSLIENNADLKAKKPDGWSALHLAARYNSIDVVKYLVNQGSDINAQTIYKGKENYTPLHLALFRTKEELNDQEAIVKYLIGVNSNLMIKDSFNKTAEQEARIKRLFKLNKYFQNTSIAKNEIEEDKKKQQRVVVNEFIKNKDFKGLKEYTDKNPSAAYYISDNSLRLMFTGPRGMKVGDIRKLLKQGKSEVIVVSLIKRVKTPYKEFTLDEIDTLIEMDLSDNIIAAMIDVTTELLKDEERKKEQQFLLSEQQRIAKENSKTKVIYQNTPGVKVQQKTVGDVILDKAVDKAVDKGVDMLLRKLF